MTNKMRVAVLGPLGASMGGRPLPLGGRKRRTVLGVLLLRPNRLVAADSLVEAVWRGRPPPTASTSLQNHVRRLRIVLGPQRILFEPPGYVVRVDAGELDSLRFEALLERAAGKAGHTRAKLFREALGLWRGSVLADLDADDFARSEVARLEELRLTALEDRIEADLELGSALELVAELQALVHAYPLRERFLEQLMLVLYRSGRQADALAAYREARRRLLDDLGLDPSEALKRLERAILAHESPLSPRARQEVPLSLLQRAIELAPADYETRADLAYRLGVGLQRLGEREHAREALDEARHLARRVGARAIEARAELELSLQEYYGEGLQLHEHRERVERLVGEFEALRDGLGLGLALLARANARRDSGHVAAALRDYRRAANHTREAVGGSWPTGLILAVEGFTLHLGPTPVGEAIRRCEAILHEIDWGPPGPIGVYAALGVLFAMRGDAGTGRSFAARAVTACEEYGLAPLLEGSIRPCAATVEELAGAEATAIGMLQTAYDRVEAVKAPAGIGVVAPRLARLLAAQGDANRALALAVRAEEVAAVGDLVARIDWLRARARARAAAGAGAAAVRDARRAVRGADATDWLPLRAEAYLDLAHALAAAGRMRDAVEAAERAAELYDEKGNVVGAARARAFS
jgi:DNA-binding SARP family transcriptional activator